MRVLTPLPWLAPLLGGCLLFPSDARPTADLRAEYADKFVQRGMPQNRNGVVQGSLDVHLPTRNGGQVTVGTFANMDLNDNVGRAWFADGHAGRFSSIEYSGSYAQSLGPVDVEAGLENYNVPFGFAFPNGPRSSTTEVFVHASTELLGATPEVQLRYDIDQADGFYGRVGIREDFPITDDVQIVTSGFVGYTSNQEALWNYGIAKSGLSDLEASMALLWTYDANTVLGLRGSLSTILDSGLQDWFDLIDIPTTNIWVGVFVGWSY